MKTVTKLSYIRHFLKIFFNFILHFIFRKHLQFFFVMKALPITSYIDIYVCYIDIYVCYYESLFSLYWHIVRSMSRRMNFLKAFTIYVIRYYESLFSLYWHIVRNMSRRVNFLKAFTIYVTLIFIRYYESLFSLDWHIIRNMSSRMTFLKISCKG